jgi:hypothetical protein
MKPPKTSRTQKIGARMRLRLRAAELIVEAMSSSDLRKRENLLAEAHALIAKADEKTLRNGDLR